MYDDILIVNETYRNLPLRGKFREYVKSDNLDFKKSFTMVVYENFVWFSRCLVEGNIIIINLTCRDKHTLLQNTELNLGELV